MAESEDPGTPASLHLTAGQDAYAARRDLPVHQAPPAQAREEGRPGTRVDGSIGVQVGSGNVQINLHEGNAAGAGVTCSLPLDAAAFTGRGADLDRVTASVTRAEAAGVAAVHPIAGMPGVGKTALAVHAAHLLRHWFPDRQLFIDLHAHTPGRAPVLPEEALGALLTATGADARHLPADLDR